MVGKKQLFKLPEQPEFVFEEEIAARKRGWTENLQFYTGVGYLAGVQTLPGPSKQWISSSCA